MQPSGQMVDSLTIRGIERCQARQEILNESILSYGKSMNSAKEADFVLYFTGDIVKARAEGKAVARKLAFKGSAVTTIATVVSDMAHDMARYATSGRICVARIDERNLHGVQFTLRTHRSVAGDKVEAALGKTTTRRHLDSDLARFKPFMDEFNIHSEMGGKITMVMKKWF